MARPRTKYRIDSAPLLARIARFGNVEGLFLRGGLAVVMQEAGIPAMIVPDEPEPTLLDDLGAEFEAPAGVPTLAYLRYHRALLRAVERGWVDYFWADDFAITVLGVHPVEVWGGDWYTAPDDDELQDALAGKELVAA